MGTQLTTTEARRLAEYEATIRNGLNSWLDVSYAMIAIHDKGLYRDKAKTFEGYCKAEFGLTRQRVYQLIESRKAVSVLSTIVDIPPPANEGIARELAKVETDEAKADIWVRANETAPKDKKTGEPRVTAAHLAKTRKAALGEGAPEPSCTPQSAEPPNEFAVELDELSARFRVLAEQDVEAVLLRLALLSLEFEGEGDMGV